MRRLASAALIGILGLIVAVTPLDAVVQPNDFELPFQGYGCPGGVRQVMARLHDETGLVQNLTLSMLSRVEQLTPTRTILVDWEGDSDVSAIWLEFSAADGRYRVDIRTSSDQCPIGVGLGLRFALTLRTPVDPTLLDVVND